MNRNCAISVFSVVAFLSSVACLPEELLIGGLFESNEELNRVAFIKATDLVNADEEVLPHSTLIPKVRDVPEFDSFQVGNTVCGMLSEGLAGVLGPKSRETWDHVQSLCDTMEVPHIETRWDHAQRRGSCLVNFYPHPLTLSKAIADIVEAWNWKGFTVIYDDDYAVMKIENLLKMADFKDYMVMVQQLNISDPDNNYRPMLRNIKATGEKNLVIECSIERLYNILIQAQQVGLMTNDMNIIISTLDFQTIELDPFKWSGTNITGIRLVDPDNPQVSEVLASWTAYLEEQQITTTTAVPFVEPCMIHDAVLLFSKALHNLEKSLEVNTRSINCDLHNSWEHGYSIINYMKMSELEGLTGLIKFDHQGFRSDFQLDIVELQEGGLVKKGTWNITTGYQMAPLPPRDAVLEGEDLRNMTFTVLIALTAPYGMLKESSQKLSGNDRFEGFGIDLIHELSLMSGFNYTFRVQADKSSGNPITNSTKWTGMIGEVIDGRADLAIADITITREREAAIDFTMPFMNLGISILYRKPTKQPPSLFSFMSPFSYEVWFYMIAAYMGVSLLLFVMARISPYEWRNPYPCIEEPTELENQFSLNNSLWFTMGSLMQQGSDVAPISVSTRMVASIWWFFTLIMVSSYTANLAAFLTIELTVPAFRTVEELVSHKTIKYGAKAGGSTANFFRESPFPVHQKMYKFMSANPDVMMSSNEAGVSRVINNVDYAFLMESASIQYETERQCDLHQVGGLLDNKGYGIVMRKNSTYRNVLSTNVVKLQEKGKLTMLKNKWWKEKRGGGACSAESSGGGQAEELDLDNVGGVFVVMVAGLVFAVFVAFAEALWDIHMKEDKVSFKEELIDHLRFVAQCHGTIKQVKKPDKSKSSKSSNKSQSSKSEDHSSKETSTYNRFIDRDTLD